MNLEIFNIATQGVAAIGRFLVGEDRASLNKYEVELVALTDDELRARCLQAIHGEDTWEVSEDERRLPAIISYIAWFRRRASSLSLKRLALAIEAFKRAPADLPVGTALYSQQVQAASLLTRRCLIQMDTGEGKTYALLPAAFALACEYQQVYIVCANEYLAWRDAHRTRVFWDFTGMRHGLCLGKDTDDWSSRVIYTTLPTLIFKHMSDLARIKEAPTPISFGAILLDEADAILLDEGDTTFTITHNIRAEAFDWSFALNYVEDLNEGEDIETDLSTLDSNLTIAGETRLRETMSQKGLPESTYLLTRFAVELAYVAVKVAAEDRDYVVDDDCIYAVDPVTGKVLRTVSPYWLIPLEVRKGFPTRTEQIAIDAINTLTFLEKFQHLSGLSGTIADDALEYLLLYFLPMLVIKPRKKRHDGLKPDLVYRTKEEAYEAVCEKVSEAVGSRRPVLAATQTIADAEKIYRMLSDKLPPETRLHLLTGKNDYEAAQLFERGGEVGSVIVATQLAGRGVDIRLSEEAEQNGGLVLLCQGHSLTIRHDKQLLGRAGRQGSRYDAVFICSLQDELLKMAVGEKTDMLMQRLGMEHGVAVESKFVSNRLTSMQNNRRRAIFWSNQQQAVMNANNSDIRKSLETWFDYFQLSDDDSAEATATCSQEFLEWVTDFYLENVLSSMFPARRTITTQEAEQVADFLNTSLGLARRQHLFTALDIEARDTESATRTLRGLLLKKLDQEIRDCYKINASFWEPYLNSPAEGHEEAGAEQDGETVIPVPPDYGREWRLYLERTPRQIAYWSIRLGWMGFMQERRRIIHRATQKRLSYLERHRVVTDQIINEWQKTEREMATRVLSNLLRCTQPATLDDLFVYLDNSVSSPAVKEKENLFKWEAGEGRADDRFDPKENVRLIIGQFVAQVAGNLSETFNNSNLRRLLADFIEQSPLYMLQSPAQIQKALEVWKAAENERGVSTARRRVHKKWLREFLLYLRGRRLIGALPTFQTQLQSAFAKLINTVTETRTVLTILGAVAFVLFFLLVAYWGDFGEPKQLGPFGAALDQILFAGLLARGNVAAPAFGVLIITSLVTVFVFPATADALKDTVPFERTLTPVLQVAFAWWLTTWYYGQITALSLIRSLGIFCCILAVSLITRRAVGLLENSVGLNIIAVWLSYNVLFIFLLAVTAPQSAGWMPILFLAGAVSSYYFWQRINAHEIELVSTMLKSSSTSMQAEEISGNVKIKADCGVSPHIYGVLCAWLAYEFLTLDAVSMRVPSSPYLFHAIPTAVYLAVMVGRIAYVINRRFSVELWLADLNARHQMIKDVDSRAELQQKLEGMRRRLMRRELAFQLLFFVGASWVFYGAVLPGTAFPLSLILVFAAFLFGTTSRQVAIQLYKLFYDRVPLDVEVLDFSKLPEEREERSTWQLVKRTTKIIFATLMAVYGFFELITGTYQILEKLKVIQ